MPAVARDSPQTMGEAADTPHCPVVQRDRLGEGQLVLSLSDSAQMGRGGAPLSGTATTSRSWKAACSTAFKIL